MVRPSAVDADSSATTSVLAPAIRRTRTRSAIELRRRAVMSPALGAAASSSPGVTRASATTRMWSPRLIVTFSGVRKGPFDGPGAGEQPGEAPRPSPHDAAGGVWLPRHPTARRNAAVIENANARIAAKDTSNQADRMLWRQRKAT